MIYKTLEYWREDMQGFKLKLEPMDVSQLIIMDEQSKEILRLNMSKEDMQNLIIMLQDGVKHEEEGIV